MPITPITILAVDPGTKELGVAVLRSARLEYYGVKTFKHRSPPHAFLAEVTQYFSNLIEQYQPTVLAIERTFLIQRNVALLNVAAAEIIHAAHQHKLLVREYDPVQVRQTICQHAKGTKRETAQILSVRYPELSRYLLQATQWETLYWGHVFDAVAVGWYCWQELHE